MDQDGGRNAGSTTSPLPGKKLSVDRTIRLGSLINLPSRPREATFRLHQQREVLTAILKRTSARPIFGSGQISLRKITRLPCRSTSATTGHSSQIVCWFLGVCVLWGRAESVEPVRLTLGFW